MSINFDSDGAPAQWQESDITNLATGMTAKNLSFGGWARITESLGRLYIAMTIQSSGTAGHWFRLSVDTVGQVIADHRAGGAIQGDTQSSANNFLANTWHHIMAVFDSFTVEAFLDGKSTSDNGILVTPASIDEVSAGTFDGDTVNTWHGDLCRWGLWSSALVQADISLLAANRLAPPLVSPSTLEHYFKWGNKDDGDAKDGLTWSTVTGSPTTTADVPNIQDAILQPVSGSTMMQAPSTTIRVNAY